MSEEHSTPDQGVNVGSVDVRVSVGSEIPVSKVVDQDEEDVGGCRGWDGAEDDEECETHAEPGSDACTRSYGNPAATPPIPEESLAG